MGALWSSWTMSVSPLQHEPLIRDVDTGGCGPRRGPGGCLAGGRGRQRQDEEGGENGGTSEHGKLQDSSEHTTPWHSLPRAGPDRQTATAAACWAGRGAPFMICAVTADRVFLLRVMVLGVLASSCMKKEAGTAAVPSRRSPSPRTGDALADATTYLAQFCPRPIVGELSFMFMGGLHRPDARGPPDQRIGGEPTPSPPPLPATRCYRLTTQRLATVSRCQWPTFGQGGGLGGGGQALGGPG